MTRGDGLGGGTASSQGEEGGGRRKTSGKGRHLGEKVSDKMRRSPRAQPDDGESDDGEEHGKRSSRDKEGEDTEDMREFKTLCWDCKCGDYRTSHFSRRQWREVLWILLSYCDYAVLCVMRIFCVICYNSL